MRTVFYTLVLLVTLSCDKEDAWDCIQTAGAPAVQVLNVEAFERILVNRDIKLVVKQGHDYKVEIQTATSALSVARK